jgi:DICT domain-containing protein
MKQVPSNIRDPVSDQFNRPEFYRNQFHRYKGVAGEKPVVGKVLLSANDDSFLVVKTLVRHVRYASVALCCCKGVLAPLEPSF